MPIHNSHVWSFTATLRTVRPMKLRGSVIMHSTISVSSQAWAPSLGRGKRIGSQMRRWFVMKSLPFFPGSLSLSRRNATICVMITSRCLSSGTICLNISLSHRKMPTSAAPPATDDTIMRLSIPLPVYIHIYPLASSPQAGITYAYQRRPNKAILQNGSRPLTPPVRPRPCLWWSVPICGGKRRTRAAYPLRSDSAILWLKAVPP